MKKIKSYLSIIMTVLLSYYVIGLFTSVLAQTPSFPILSVASPTEKTTIFGKDVVISFVVGNFKFVDFRQKSTKGKNEGHVALWVDEPNPTKENAERLLSPSDITVQSLPEGVHLIRLEIVHNDKSSYSPPIVKEVLFTIKYPPPTSIPSPTRGSTIERVRSFLRPEYFIGIFGGGLIVIGVFVFTAIRKSSEQ